MVSNPFLPAIGQIDEGSCERQGPTAARRDRRPAKGGDRSARGTPGTDEAPVRPSGLRQWRSDRCRYVRCVDSSSIRGRNWSLGNAGISVAGHRTSVHTGGRSRRTGSAGRFDRGWDRVLRPWWLAGPDDGVYAVGQTDVRQQLKNLYVFYISIRGIAFAPPFDAAAQRVSSVGAGHGPSDGGPHPRAPGATARERGTLPVDVSPGEPTLDATFERVGIGIGIPVAVVQRTGRRYGRQNRAERTGSDTRVPSTRPGFVNETEPSCCIRPSPSPTALLTAAG